MERGLVTLAKIMGVRTGTLSRRGRWETRPQEHRTVSGDWGQVRIGQTCSASEGAATFRVTSDLRILGRCPGAC